MTQEPFPHDASPLISLTGGGAFRVAAGATRQTVVPVRIRYKGYSTSYCRLAVFAGDAPAWAFVALPDDATAGSNSCEEMRKMAYVDVNHDGVPDLVYQVYVKSNRYAATVSDGAVFLSQPAGEAFCYSPGASSAIPSDTSYDPLKIRAQIEAAVTRLGTQTLDCYSPVKQKRP